jgi:hypothetical protein
MIEVLIALPVFLSSGAQHPEPLKIPLTVEDREYHKHTIYFGFHPKATYGFDDGLGETPIPPVPTVPAFDVRFLDPHLRKQFPGDGAYHDIRKYVSRNQTDTFYVRVQPANRSFPVIVSWPEKLGQFFRKIVLMYSSHGTSYVIDMTTRTRLTLEEDEQNSFMIITSGLKGHFSWKN